MKIIEGNMKGKGCRIGIVVARFNDFITKRLLDACLDELSKLGVLKKDVTVVWVPGAVEIPVVCQKLARSGKYDAIIALGCVIQGGTPHFEYVASEAAKGIAKVSLDSGVPVIFGILTTDTLEQALERAGAKPGNKGFAAALSAIELANLDKEL